MNFQFFYYENYEDAAYDENNPRYVLKKKEASEILTKLVSAKPLSIKKEELPHQEVVALLLHIGVIKETAGIISIAAPIFIEKDLESLKALSHDAAKEIVNSICSQKDTLRNCVKNLKNGFSDQINLYHLLCGQIFDGLMFDYLEENKLVTTSKLHSSGLDYLVIIYEDSEKLSAYSDRLLCSYNRLQTEKGAFCSFGDSFGNRKDFYRYFRRKELDQITKEEESLQIPEKDLLVLNFNSFLEGKDIDQAYLNIFEYFGYLKNNQINIPIYSEAADAIIDELYAIILDCVKEPIARSLQLIGSSTLFAVLNEVDLLDIANEIYHLIFGEVNELLVSAGIVATPDEKNGEGRYLKCYEIYS